MRIGGDIKDVYSEAKGVGYDVKTMRKIVSLRSMDAADRAEGETLLDVYKESECRPDVGRRASRSRDEARGNRGDDNEG